MAATAPKPPSSFCSSVPLRIGVDELNVCEFPLFAASHSTNDGAISFEDDIFDDGANQHVHRKLTISASREFGLPTAADSDVLLVLMYFTKLQNGFTQPKVSFTRYELIELLRWQHAGKSYRRIQESLQRWASVTLFYNRAWWDRSGRRWRSKTFHVLETVDLRGRGDAQDDGQSTFTWNATLFESFRANNVKRLDLDTYFKLKSPTARQAFRFLDKRFYRSKRLEMDLRRFACEHLGLGRDYDVAQLRRKLQPAIEELETIGFLEPAITTERFHRQRRGEWTIALVRRLEPHLPSSHSTSATSIDVGLVRELTNRGVSETSARELVIAHAGDKIRAKIALLDQKLKGGKKPTNPPGFLAAAIRGDYATPSAAKVVAIPLRPSTKRLRADSNAAAKADVHLLEQFRMRPNQERQVIETEAIASAPKLLRDAYLRHKQLGGAKFAGLRDEVILSLLRKTT